MRCLYRRSRTSRRVRGYRIVFRHARSRPAIEYACGRRYAAAGTLRLSARAFHHDRRNVRSPRRARFRDPRAAGFGGRRRRDRANRTLRLALSSIDSLDSRLGFEATLRRKHRLLRRNPLPAARRTQAGTRCAVAIARVVYLFELHPPYFPFPGRHRTSMLPTRWCRGVALVAMQRTSRDSHGSRSNCRHGALCLAALASHLPSGGRYEARSSPILRQCGIMYGRCCGELFSVWR